MPGQDIRKRSLHFKLHPIELEFKNKNVLLVDDSIVRGNTSKKIVALVREAGAKKVYFASTAPPIICPDPYGIDLPTKEELIASNLSPKEISKHMGADWVFYGKIEDLHKAVQYGNKDIKKFSEGCFTCKYPTPEVDAKLLKSLGYSRNKSRDHFVHDLDDDATKMMTLV
jgi:amidophosphoribosyltransferase